MVLLETRSFICLLDIYQFIYTIITCIEYENTTRGWKWRHVIYERSHMWCGIKTMGNYGETRCDLWHQQWQCFSWPAWASMQLVCRPCLHNSVTSSGGGKMYFQVYFTLSQTIGKPTVSSVFNLYPSILFNLNNFLVSSLLFLSMMVTPPKVLGNNFLLPYEIQRTGGGYLSVRYLSCYYRRGTVIELQHHHPHPWKDDKLANSLLPEPGKDVNLRLKFIQI